MTNASVTVLITPESQPATPSWMGEVAAFAQVLTHTGTLDAIAESVGRVMEEVEETEHGSRLLHIFFSTKSISQITSRTKRSCI